MSGLRFEFDDEALDRLAASIAERIGQRSGPEPWVGVAQAAEHLNCKPQRIYALVHARSEIPGRLGIG